MRLLRVTAVLLLAGVLTAAEPANFTGVWQLNLALSRMKDGQPLRLNKSHTIAVKQNGKTIDWHEHRITSDDVFHATFAQLTPGVEEAVLVGFSEGKTNRSFVSVVIDSNRLVQKFHGTTAQGKEFRGTRTLILAPDGKSLSATVEVNRFGELLAWSETWDRL